MWRFDAQPEDLARTRFAVSPLFELVTLLRILNGMGPRLPSAWSGRLRDEFARLRVEAGLDLVLALVSRHRGAGFIAPPPLGMAQTVEQDLDAVRATPAGVARQEIEKQLALARSVPRGVLDAVRGPKAVLLVADALEAAWHGLLAADWPRMRVICERDVLFRSGQLGHSGWRGALDGLHPAVRWHDGAIEMRLRKGAPEGTTELGGAGLLLVPPVFLWPDFAF